ncbi:uncharacterized protein TrAtP1_010461 [Trichoderma atroviride]|uniref:C2H2-type domain-containing protein n=1 Tax=Hypocrea atroviridis (strain ATCC 20476 / IMI 206040) TaxID=452589 RepID=G9NQV8_HYPAI|nr:uncharacterized protein TRIATDRAFT_291209 [Trichoderma atroviride IMI 206040]EHK46928.1 hypothetical protein TRIATDRAFT_291209 [Trichoderma atroviride IMI 206040]KAK1239882.1 hypothetical protein MKX08_007324 [Trichoderma sp. CBMAI-0020]UKZ69453.1 hypothetical protein TrAtP1_010461 [Trichoderma atroviride]
MAFPPQYREAPPALPSIIVPGSGANRYRDDLTFSRSPAMAIPGMDTRDDVPPPLPPPRVLPFGDAPTQYRDDSKDKKESSRGSSFASRSSLASGYGSMSPCHLEERPGYRRREAGSINSDEGYASYASTERSRDSIPIESFGLHHNRFQFQSAADIHGDSMKSLLTPIRTLERSPPRSLLTGSLSDIARGLQSEGRFAPSFNNLPIQLPIHSRAPFESQTRDSPTFSAVSPLSTPFYRSPIDRRSPYDSSEPDRSPRGRSRRNNSDDATSTQGSFADDMDMEETSSLKRLHIEDAYASAGQKRRAASPASDDLGLHMIPGQGASRGSPTPRLSTGAQTATSILSSAPSRSGFLMSSISIPSTTTASCSFGHRSPGGVSPGALSPTSCTSPYNTPASLNPSPKTSVASRASLHSRTTSGAGPRKLAEMAKPAGAKFQGFYMCECCPKKPKKFETAEELSAHEAEKQYECSFCGNRFKNKNEAERHQNSLHVRRHSWSCSALSGYNRAFHESTTHPGEADACGYCGEEFPRSGLGARAGLLNGGIQARHATDQDWEERIRHLQEQHKFRECNSSKKFFRADHFRQHLKHSHAGTSGKWTNMLENACLMEEDPSPR